MDIEREHERWTAIERQNWYIRARLRLLTNEEGGTPDPDRLRVPLTLGASP